MSITYQLMQSKKYLTSPFCMYDQINKAFYNIESYPQSYHCSSLHMPLPPSNWKHYIFSPTSLTILPLASNTIACWLQTEWFLDMPHLLSHALLFWRSNGKNNSAFHYTWPFYFYCIIKKNIQLNTFESIFTPAFVGLLLQFHLLTSNLK